MVRNELNVPYSPFAYRRGERLNVLHPRGEGMPMRLSELEQKILVLINSSLVTTSYLLGKHLAQLGWEENANTIRAVLDRLFRNKYIIKMEFMTSETRSLTKVFALGRYGVAYIRSIGEVPNRTKFVSTLDVVGAKKLLAAAQYLLWENHITDAQGITMGAMVMEEVKPGYHTDNCFRSQAVVNTGDGRTVFVLAVRSEPLAFRELREKLYRVEQTVSGRYKLNMSVGRPEVILVCETEAHQETVAQQLLEKECAFDFPLYLTNDAQTFGEPRQELYRYPGKKKLVIRFADSLFGLVEKVMEA